MCYKQKCKVVSLNLAHPVYLISNSYCAFEFSFQPTELTVVLLLQCCVRVSSVWL